MIQSFKDAGTKELYETGSSQRWGSIRAAAVRKLDQIETAINLSNLRVPPGNIGFSSSGKRTGLTRSKSPITTDGTERNGTNDYQ